MTLCTGTYCKLSGRKCYYEVDPVCPLAWVDLLRWMIGLRIRLSREGT